MTTLWQVNGFRAKARPADYWRFAESYSFYLQAILPPNIANSKEAANKILGCFGLSVDDLYNEFGHPTTGTDYEVDLPTVVRRCYNL